MSQLNGPCRIPVTVFNDGGVCRVHPPTTRVNVNDDGSYREEILFESPDRDVLIVLPAGAVVSDTANLIRFPVSEESSAGSKGLVGLAIPKKSSETVIAGQEGAYRYVVAWLGEQGVQSAVGDSDPVIIVGRRP
jgi:hypothetical protein